MKISHSKSTLQQRNEQSVFAGSEVKRARRFNKFPRNMIWNESVAPSDTINSVWMQSSFSL
jgi:hypothetical protein